MILLRRRRGATALSIKPSDGGNCRVTSVFDDFDGRAVSPPVTDTRPPVDDADLGLGRSANFIGSRTVGVDVDTTRPDWSDAAGDVHVLTAGPSWALAVVNEVDSSPNSPVTGVCSTKLVSPGDLAVDP